MQREYRIYQEASLLKLQYILLYYGSLQTEELAFFCLGRAGPSLETNRQYLAILSNLVKLVELLHKDLNITHRNIWPQNVFYCYPRYKSLR